MAKIGIVDCDHMAGGKFPNLPLMKLSAYHKKQGDIVEWYTPFDHFDRVYISRVFTSSPDYNYYINADEVVRGGSGYAIRMNNGREQYDKTRDKELPHDIEHIYPDYSLYGLEDTAVGYLTRGCPRGCEFCIVQGKEGACSVQVAELSEFWRGQKYIILCDPNLLACKNRMKLLHQLAESGAYVDFNQGLDARMLTPAVCKAIANIKIKTIHFAWDRYEDGRIILPKLRMFAELGTRRKHHKATVYVLVNFGSTRAQDLERIYTLRDMNYDPYVMIYDKSNADEYHHKLQRWVNNKFIFATVKDFNDYDASVKYNRKK